MGERKYAMEDAFVTFGCDSERMFYSIAAIRGRVKGFVRLQE
jgi:hypothetical protein